MHATRWIIDKRQMAYEKKDYKKGKKSLIIPVQKWSRNQFVKLRIG